MNVIKPYLRRMEVLDLEEKERSASTGVFAILSFCLPVLIACLLIYATVTTPVIKVSDPSPGFYTHTPSLWSIITMWVMVLTGPLFTVISYVRRERRSFFKVAGLILNSLVLLLVAFSVVLALLVDGGFY